MLFFAVEIKLSARIREHLARCKSTEIQTQRDRENTVLAAVYFEDRHIPSSASEPDPAETSRAAPPALKIIPLYDASVSDRGF